MKQLFTILAAVIIASGVFAQSPPKMSYQAVIRNSSDQLVTNHAIGMKISILQGSLTGTVVYSETQTATSNSNGLVSIEIGNGTGFNNIDWNSGPFFIKTETDPNGGTAYTITGTSQLLSVPYALHAKTAESITGNLTETDPVWTSASNNYYTKTNMQTSGSSQVHFDNLTNKPTTIAGYGILDAMSTAHAANAITSADIKNWISAFGWGNHAGLYRPISYVPAWNDITSNPFSFTAATNNQILRYNSTSGKWENWTPDFATSTAETDPTWTAASANYYTKSNMQTSGSSQLHFNNVTNKPTTVAGYGILDAMTTGHAANGITATSISNWNTAFSWGNHAGLYRPIDYVPTWSDINSNPFSISSVANNQLLKYNSTTGKWENWTPDFLKTYTETDPIWTSASANYYTKTNLQTSGSSQVHFNNLTNKPTTIAGYGILDAMTTAHAANALTSADIANWNTAFAWGNHATAGYQPMVVAGTNTQYWRGDKTWQTLNQTAVGLGNVENIALSTWVGSTSISTLGSVTSGIWNAGAVTSSGNVTGNKIVKSGGTASQFLKADGSVDANTYITAVREVADESTATASQTSFTLTQTPSANSKVKMYINGVRISNTAYSITGNLLTYVQANNGAYALMAGDRIQFDYYY